MCVFVLKDGGRGTEGGREEREREDREREREQWLQVIVAFAEKAMHVELQSYTSSSSSCSFLYYRFFCDCGAGTLGRNCLLTGYKAYSSPKVSKNGQQSQGQQSQDTTSHQHPNIPVQQDQNTSTS